MATRKSSTAVTKSRLRLRGKETPIPGMVEVIAILLIWYYLPFFLSWTFNLFAAEPTADGILGFAPALQSVLQDVMGIDITPKIAGRIGQDGLRLLTTIGLLIYAFAFRRFDRRRFGFTSTQAREPWKTTGLLALLAGGAFALILLVILVSAALYPSWFGAAPDTPAPLILYQLTGSGVDEMSSLPWLVSVILLAPLMEELLFRSWLYPSLRDNFSARTSIIFCALLFAYAHGGDFPLSQLIGGVVFSYAFERTRTIVVPFLLHMLGNATHVFLSWYIASWMGLV